MRRRLGIVLAILLLIETRSTAEHAPSFAPLAPGSFSSETLAVRAPPVPVQAWTALYDHLAEWNFGATHHHNLRWIEGRREAIRAATSRSEIRTTDPDAMALYSRLVLEDEGIPWEARKRLVSPILERVWSEATPPNDLAAILLQSVIRRDTQFFETLMDLLGTRQGVGSLVLSPAWQAGLRSLPSDTAGLAIRALRLASDLPEAWAHAPVATDAAEPGGILIQPRSIWAILPDTPAERDFEARLLTQGGAGFYVDMQDGLSHTRTIGPDAVAFSIPGGVPEGRHTLTISTRIETEVLVPVLYVDPAKVVRSERGAQTYIRLPPELWVRGDTDTFPISVIDGDRPYVLLGGMMDTYFTGRPPFLDTGVQPHLQWIEIHESHPLVVAAGLFEGITWPNPAEAGGLLDLTISGSLAGSYRVSLDGVDLTRARDQAISSEPTAWILPDDVEPGVHALTISEGRDGVTVPFRILPPSVAAPAIDPFFPEQPGWSFFASRAYPTFDGVLLNWSEPIDSAGRAVLVFEETSIVVPARYQGAYGRRTMTLELRPDLVGRAAWVFVALRTPAGWVAAGDPWHGTIGASLKGVPLWNSGAIERDSGFEVFLHTNLPTTASYRMEIRRGDRVEASIGPCREETGAYLGVFHATFRGPIPDEDRILARLVLEGPLPATTQWLPVYPRQNGRVIRSAGPIRALAIYDALTRFLMGGDDTAAVENAGHRYLFELIPAGPNEGVIVTDERMSLVASYRSDPRYGGYLEYADRTDSIPGVRLSRPLLAHRDLPGVVADALRFEAGADFGACPRSGVRGHLPDGLVTWHQLYLALPFDDEVVVIEMSRDEVARLVMSQEDARMIVTSGLRLDTSQADLGLASGRYSVAVPGYLVDSQRAGGGRLAMHRKIGDLQCSVQLAVVGYLAREP